MGQISVGANTTGELSPEAKALIETARACVSGAKYTILVRNSEEVQAIADSTNDRGLIDLLRQHFVRHPLADADGTLLGYTAGLPTLDVATPQPTNADAAATLAVAALSTALVNPTSVAALSYSK